MNRLTLYVCPDCKAVFLFGYGGATKTCKVCKKKRKDDWWTYDVAEEADADD